MRQLFAFLLLTLAGVMQLSASVCVADTLANYEALAGGCTLGPFTMTGFTYAQVSGSVTIPDTGIMVMPMVTGTSWSLTFSSPDFNLSSPDSAVYRLGYTYDPGDIRSFEDVLTTDPPVFPGLAEISTSLCENSAFSGSSCPTTIDSVTVSDNGVTHTLSDSFTFSPDLSTLGVLNTITLDASAGGSSTFSSFSNIAAIPEPSTLATSILFGGVLGLRALLRARRG